MQDVVVCLAFLLHSMRLADVAPGLACWRAARGTVATCLLRLAHCLVHYLCVAVSACTQSNVRLGCACRPDTAAIMHAHLCCTLASVGQSHTGV
jgi:hypothetical protein